MEYSFQQTEQGDLYVALVSNRSLDYFSNNTPYCFRNQLLRPLNLSAYEFGLSEIYFTDNFQLPDPSIPTVETKSEKVNLFPPGENVLSVYQMSYSKASVKKSDLNLNAFFNEISFKIQRIFGNQVTIDNQFVGENRQTRIIVKDTGHVLSLFMPDSLSRILGFETTVFLKGEYLAPNFQSNELFEQLDQNLPLVITLNKLIVTAVPIDEPDSNDIISVLEHCVEILLKYNFDISIPVRPNNDVVYVDIEGYL